MVHPLHAKRSSLAYFVPNVVGEPVYTHFETANRPSDGPSQVLQVKHNRLSTVNDFVLSIVGGWYTNTHLVKFETTAPFTLYKYHTAANGRRYDILTRVMLIAS